MYNNYIPVSGTVPEGGCHSGQSKEVPCPYKITHSCCNILKMLLVPPCSMMLD